MKRYSNPSPLVKAYYTDFKVAMICDVFMFAAFLTGFILSFARYESISMLVDPILSVALSIYMIISGLSDVSFRLIPKIMKSDTSLSDKLKLNSYKIVNSWASNFSEFLK